MKALTRCMLASVLIVLAVSFAQADIGEIYIVATGLDPLDWVLQLNNTRKIARASNGTLYVVYAKEPERKPNIYLAKFTKQAKTWQEEQLTESQFHQKNPSIAVDSQDNIHIVWQGKIEGNDSWQIRYRKYDSLQRKWQNIENLTSEECDQENPTIAVDSQDNIHVAWNGKIPGYDYSQIRYRKYTNSWQMTEDLISQDYCNLCQGSTWPSCNQDHPILAIDSNDNLHLVWQGKNYWQGRSSGTSYGIYYRKYNKYDGAWQNIEQLKKASFDGNHFPSIATGINGDIHVVWERTRADGDTGQWLGPHQIWYQKYTTIWEAPIKLYERPKGYSGYQEQPSVSLDSEGNIYVVWYGRESLGKNYQIYSKQYTDSWQETEMLVVDNNHNKYPNLLFGFWPEISGEKTNIPKTGYALVYQKEGTLMFYPSPNLSWPESQPTQSDISLSVQDHDFGDVLVGDYTDWNLVISNVGDADLTVDSITSDNPVFTIPSPDFPQNISPGNNLGVTVKFSPTEEKSYTGTLTIASDDPDEPKIFVSLEGRGVPDIGCAIIVTAKGGPWYRPSFDGLIDRKARKAYRSLRNLGFDDVRNPDFNNDLSDRICYLDDKTQDADGDGDNDVDSSPTRDNLKKAITEWAPERMGPSSPLIIYVVGHGDKAKGYVNFKKDGVSGDDLNKWLGDFSTKIGERFSKETKILIVIDTCYSGSFITDYLMSISSPNRIIVTSTRDDKLLSGILNRFGYSFFNQLEKGENVLQAFIKASGVPDVILGEPWLDDNGDREGHPAGSLEDDGNFAATMTIGRAGVVSESDCFTSGTLCSPGELRVYDSEGRVTGLVNGTVKEEIPNSIYVDIGENKDVIIFPPNNTYYYEVVGTNTGTYGLEVASVKEEEAITFVAIDIPTTTGAVHQYTIDWEILSQGEKGATVQIDFDGDGTFEQTITTGSTLAPPVADAGGPYEGYEGASITFEGSNSYDSDGDTLQYRWDFNSDGIWNTEWSVEPTVNHTWGDNYQDTVKLEVSDGGFTDTDTASVTVKNIAPTVKAGSDKTITAGDYVEFSGSFTDPGWLDTHTALWDYGDETTKAGDVTEENDEPDATGTVSGNHSYFKAGDYTVTLKVTDDEEAESSDTLKVTVKPIKATIDFNPDTLKVKGGGKWVTTYIELPEGYGVERIVEEDDDGNIIHHAKIDFKKKPDDDKVRVQGKLGLDLVNGNGVDISEDVTVTVGPLSETITMVEKGKKGEKWEYKRPKGSEGNIKHMTINWKNGKFDIRMDKADLTGLTNPVTISIQIGDDFGEETILMREKEHHWDYKYHRHIGWDDYRSLIDISTVKLNGQVPAVNDSKYGFVKDPELKDRDENGLPELTVKFDRTAVQEILEVGNEVEITVTGSVEYNNGYDTGLADFKGKDTIRVIDKGGGRDDDEPKAAPKGKGTPVVSKLGQSFPNPSNPETWIPFNLAQDAKVAIKIYNIKGQLIQTLNLGHKRAGFYRTKQKAAYWDGRNEAGERVSSGVYFYHLQAGDYSATKLMLVLK